MDMNSQEYKDLIKDNPHASIIEAIIKDLNAVGETSIDNFETINKDFDVLKKLVDDSSTNLDPLVKEQVSKLSEDITVRHDEMEKAISKRMDDFEVSVQRLPKGGDVNSETIKIQEKALEDFRRTSMTVKAGDTGITTKRFNSEKEGVTIDHLNNYVKEFDYFLRNSEKSITPDQFKDLSVGIDPDGGYTVTPAMGARIIQRVYESDPIRQLASVESITTGAIEWAVDFDEANGGWESEYVATDDDTTPKMKKKRIPVHPLATRPKATQTLLEDSGINIESWLAGHVGRKFGRIEGAAFVSGDGVGKPRGFLTNANYTTAGVDEWGKVEQINMGAAAALTADGFSDIKYSMVEDMMDRGTWLMNRTTVREAMQLKDGEGRYIWQPGLQADQPSMLLGLPLRMSTTMPSIAAGAYSVCLADWAEFYMIVDRLGITVQRDPYTVKPFVEFYTRKRVGGDVINYQAGKIGVVAA